MTTTTTPKTFTEIALAITSGRITKAEAIEAIDNAEELTGRELKELEFLVEGMA
jgi:hypothetical protein